MNVSLYSGCLLTGSMLFLGIFVLCSSHHYYFFAILLSRCND